MKFLMVVLIGLFGAATVVRQEERGEHCDNCERENSCASSDASEGTTGHAHGDADDRHESPDSPCHHHQKTQCCCAHVPTLTLAQSLGWDLHLVSEFFTMGDTHRVEAPSAREFFHVPIA